MKIIHTFIKCLCCCSILEVFDDEMYESRQVSCPTCGKINSLEDRKIEIWEEEF